MYTCDEGVNIVARKRTTFCIFKVKLFTTLVVDLVDLAYETKKIGTQTSAAIMKVSMTD